MNGEPMIKSLPLLIFIIFISSSQLFAQSTIEADLKSFVGGKKARFSTADHPKARGLDIQVDIPNNWKKKEGERPHIIQKFSSAGGDGIAKVATLSITPIPSQMKGFTDKEIADTLFDPKLAAETLPENSKLVTASPTKYDGEPGILLYYVTQMSSVGANFASLVVSHRFLHKRATVDFTIAYSVLITSAQRSLTQQEGEAFLGLAIQMGNSIILAQKYKAR
jgi:hypothetical protein